MSDWLEKANLYMLTNKQALGARIAVLNVMQIVGTEEWFRDWIPILNALYSPLDNETEDKLIAADERIAELKKDLEVYSPLLRWMRSKPDLETLNEKDARIADLEGQVEAMGAWQPVENERVPCPCKSAKCNAHIEAFRDEDDANSYGLRVFNGMHAAGIHLRDDIRLCRKVEKLNTK